MKKTHILILATQESEAIDQVCCQAKEYEGHTTHQ